MAHKQSRNNPQPREPLKWGEGAKNPTASRHQGCHTSVTTPRIGMLDELMVESYENMKRRLKARMNCGIGCHGPADTQNTERERCIKTACITRIITVNIKNTNYISIDISNRKYSLFLKQIFIHIQSLLL